jgi:hypothetical protein
MIIIVGLSERTMGRQKRKEKVNNVEINLIKIKSIKI